MSYMSPTPVGQWGCLCCPGQVIPGGDSRISGGRLGDSTAAQVAAAYCASLLGGGPDCSLSRAYNQNAARRGGATGASQQLQTEQGG